MLGACGDELTRTADILNQGDPGETVVAESSPLRLQSIEELENLSTSDLPGDFAGYEIEEISWECTDTVEMSRLLLDIDATLISPTHQRRAVRFSADVGPDLVSVEYYPGGEWVPPHDNLVTACFYPKVERYRNYSDGSRIGPDVFYDYGHFLDYRHVDGSIYNITPETAFDIAQNIGVPTMFVGMTDTNSIKAYDNYEDGIYTTIFDEHLYYNLNAKALLEDGSIVSGEDLLPIYVEKSWIPLFDYQDFTNVFFNDYYLTIDNMAGYTPSMLYNSTDSDIIEALNLCKDTPDVSPSPYPSDIKSLEPGWYFVQTVDVASEWSLLSKLLLASSGHDGVQKAEGHRNGMVLEHYLQYLVIDGRIIHFSNILNYEGIRDIGTTLDISKTSDGYCVNCIREFHMYDAKFKNQINTFIHGVQGSMDEYDFSDCVIQSQKDYGELDNITRGSNAKMYLQCSYQRKDGKSIILDTKLPGSLHDIKSRRITKRTRR